MNQSNRGFDIMEKPTIMVAGNYRFTDEELFEISDSIPSAFDVKTQS